MLARNLGGDERDSAALLKVVSEGYPVIFDANEVQEKLTPECKMLLLVARDRGTFEMRATKDSFDSTERFLAAFGIGDSSPAKRIFAIEPRIHDGGECFRR